MDVIYYSDGIMVGMVCPICGVHHTDTFKYDRYSTREKLRYAVRDRINRISGEMCVNCDDRFHSWKFAYIRRYKLDFNEVDHRWALNEWLIMVLNKIRQGNYSFVSPGRLNVYPKRAYKRHSNDFLRKLEFHRKHYREVNINV